MSLNSTVPALIKKNLEGILIDWLDEQTSDPRFRRDLVTPAELKVDSQKFLTLFSEALSSGGSVESQSPAWAGVRDMLNQISRSRSEQGFSPTETATFVFSLKNPIFKRLREQEKSSPQEVFGDVWALTEIIDKLGLYTTEIYQKSRESVILRQQEDMLELSTPVVKLWNGILALPMIGTLDSGRTQVVMETLLQHIVKESADIAIIDITGVPTVDTLVAQHLIKTVTAARLMGADCIISGIRPQIAQTIVHLGVNLGEVTTKATLADAFAIALHRRGLRVASDRQRTALPASAHG